MIIKDNLLRLQGHADYGDQAAVNPLTAIINLALPKTEQSWSGGSAPPAAPVQPASSFPTWAKYALGYVAAVGVGYGVYRVARKAYRR